MAPHTQLHIQAFASCPSSHIFGVGPALHPSAGISATHCQVILAYDRAWILLVYTQWNPPKESWYKALTQNSTFLSPKILCPSFCSCQVESRLGVQTHTAYQGPQTDQVYCGFLLFHFCARHFLRMPCESERPSGLQVKELSPK